MLFRPEGSNYQLRPAKKKTTNPSYILFIQCRVVVSLESIPGRVGHRAGFTPDKISDYEKVQGNIKNQLACRGQYCALTLTWLGILTSPLSVWRLHLLPVSHRSPPTAHRHVLGFIAVVQLLLGCVAWACCRRGARCSFCQRFLWSADALRRLTSPIHSLNVLSALLWYFILSALIASASLNAP